MPYYDRLSKASYESPSGRSFSFSYRAVAREISHRVGAFEFPGVRGTLHQDRGVSGEIYPWTVYIHGPDYDLVADEFAEALNETGKGYLNHPRWGRLRVQVLRASQNEELADGAGQAVFNVQFQETLEKEFPEVEAALQQAVPQFAEEFQVSAVDNYAAQVNAVSLGDVNSLTQNIFASAQAVSTKLFAVASLSSAIASQFTAIISDIQSNAALYAANPVLYSDSILGAIRIVATVPGSTGAKSLAFASLIADLQPGEISADNSARNALLVNELIVTGAVVAMAEGVNSAVGESSSVIQSDEGGTSISVPEAGVGFQTRAEALAAAVLIRDSFVRVVNTLDRGQTAFAGEILSNAYVQSLDSYGPSAQVAASTIKAALDLAFSLPVERTLILQTDTTIINLCYELYGNVDDATLDYFILTNNINGAEIKTVPMGRRVVYYA